MNIAAFLQELENLAEKLNIKIRYEDGDFRGGLCRVNEEQLLVVNKKLSEEQRTVFIAKELSKTDLSEVYILPQIREKILEIALI